ncbi:ABC transporter ATP-binding protein/permease [Nocardia callitridis]|uniref:Thiol reductant ABC exporter subunit CydD n=1 Tax=Nocardia callitridis TaxID=648753 RepID=A0ABP9KUD0_9NOCA
MARPPIDPRLWRYARSARRYLVSSVLLSLVITGSIVVTALALSRVLAGVVTDPARRSMGEWRAELVVLAVAIVLRVAATWTQSRLAHRAGAGVVAELETEVLAAGARLPPRELDSRRTELAVIVTTGLSGLRGYLTGYLPALLLTAVVPPLVLTVIAVHDPMSGIIVLITLPLIPVFMILIGLLTQGRAAATLAASTRLSDQLLDLFAGMPTLRALGREGPERGKGSGADAHAEETAQDALATSGMSKRVRDLGDALRHRTMRALRLAFLSSMVLEMLATLSVALVAVSIGLRLVFGEMSLYAGLVALILAPEVYLPLRMVGERFHAAQDGLAASDKAFEILEAAPPRGRADASVDADVRMDEKGSLRAGGGAVAQRNPTVRAGGARGVGNETAERRIGQSIETVSNSDVGRGAETASKPAGTQTGRTGIAADSFAARAPEFGVGRHEPDHEGVRVELRAVSVRTRGGMAPRRLSATLRPGAVTVLSGANGSGKSTAALAILGLCSPESGAVTVDGVDVGALEQQRWWDQVAWLPQRPVLVPGTLAENLAMLGAHETRTYREQVEKYSRATGFDTVLNDLTDGWNTLVGPGGVGLSLGQRQRLALTRVLAADRPVLLLDEPTAHLDPDSEATVLAALTARAEAGATVIVIGHRPTVLAIADHIVEVRCSSSALEEVGG